MTPLRPPLIEARHVTISAMDHATNGWTTLVVVKRKLGVLMMVTVDRWRLRRGPTKRFRVEYCANPARNCLTLPRLQVHP